MARPKATNKKKGARVVGGSSGVNIAYALGEAAGRALRPLFPLLALGVLYAGLTYLLWLPIRNDSLATLTKDQIQSPSVFPRHRQLEWLPDSELEKIRRLGLGATGRSVFEPGLAEELAKSYSESPWVRQPGTIQLSYPASIWVSEFELRRPYATVRSGGQTCLLDREGYVLPIVPHQPLDALPWISGMTVGRLPVGTRAKDANIQGGLSLLATMNEILSRCPGEQKAVGAYWEGVVWRVVLSSGATVQWGFWDEKLRPEGEMTTREKKEALARRLNEFTPTQNMVIKLDCPGAPVEIKSSAR